MANQLVAFEQRWRTVTSGPRASSRAHPVRGHEDRLDDRTGDGRPRGAPPGRCGDLQPPRPRHAARDRRDAAVWARDPGDEAADQGTSREQLAVQHTPLQGLPPTPISNPRLASIRAAANPAPVDLGYYVRKPDRIHHFFTADDEEFCRKSARVRIRLLAPKPAPAYRVGFEPASGRCRLRRQRCSVWAPHPFTSRTGRCPFPQSAAHRRYTHVVLLPATRANRHVHGRPRPVGRNPGQRSGPNSREPRQGRRDSNLPTPVRSSGRGAGWVMTRLPCGSGDRRSSGITRDGAHRLSVRNRLRPDQRSGEGGFGGRLGPLSLSWRPPWGIGRWSDPT